MTMPSGLNLVIAVISTSAFILPALELIFDKNHKLTVKGWLILLIGLSILIVTLIKSAKDDEESSSNKKIIKNLNDSTASLNESSRQLIVKLDTANSFLKKLEALGVKRDSINNTPIITKTFYNNINRVGTLIQY